ncbi:hypothetical protein [Paenibacillus sp. 1A_MP2]|uniref:hypothetical protein n=1 Tax=Paenibacillus sp. 1A_MP2 TaxID=3457495 RepID=UPI003FCD382E
MVSSRLSGGRTTRFEDVEVYHLLSETANDPGFAALFERKLGKLRAYDDEHSGDLLRTFFIIWRAGGA